MIAKNDEKYHLITLGCKIGVDGARIRRSQFYPVVEGKFETSQKFRFNAAMESFQHDSGTNLADETSARVLI